MGKFLFLLVTVTAWLSVSGLPPPSLTLSLWFPTTRLCPSLGWNPSFSLALWSRHASCLLGVQSSPRMSISSSYPSGSAHSSVCTSFPRVHCLSPVSPLCLAQVLVSQESFPSMSRLSPCSPPAAFHCDVFSIHADTVGACCGGETELEVAEPRWQQLAPEHTRVTTLLLSGFCQYWECRGRFVFQESCFWYCQSSGFPHKWQEWAELWLRS